MTDEEARDLARLAIVRSGSKQQAAERLGVSVRTLERYAGGTHSPKAGDWARAMRLRGVAEWEDCEPTKPTPGRPPDGPAGLEAVLLLVAARLESVAIRLEALADERQPRAG